MNGVNFFLLGLLCVWVALLPAQPDSLREKCLSQNPFHDRYASYSPDGSEILFESNRDGNWNIYLMSADGRNQRPLTNHVADDRRPSWHPDGKHILFESDRGGKVALFSLRIGKGKVKRVPGQPDEGELAFARYAPNGRQIAASLKLDEEVSKIVLLDKKGKVESYLTHESLRSYYPQWSPDGESLVYFSRKDTDNQDDELYRLHIASGEEQRLTQWPRHNFCPAWSHDGKHIAYVTSMEGSRPEIYLMTADGTDAKRITFNEDGETLPNWHPREYKLLITAYRGDNFEICELSEFLR